MVCLATAALLGSWQSWEDGRSEQGMHWGSRMSLAVQHLK